MRHPRTVLILGGYGTFGARLARLLAEEGDLTLMIAGRSLDRAAAFCAALPARAKLVPLVLDRDGDVQGQLMAAAPDLVVDASGPFQVYGERPYRVVEACLELGIAYIDLADGSAFVRGIMRFDAAARARGVFVLSGASTCPALTAAVARHLSRDLATVDSISAGIAPSPFAGVGLNVVRAIASYAGRPVPLRHGGKSATGYPLTDARRVAIRPPGGVPLPSLRFSLVDVPDLQVLPDLWPGLQSAWVGAGMRPGCLHWVLNGLAWLVRVGFVSSLLPLAGLFHRVSQRLRWGEHRGGMYVEVAGRAADGMRREGSWHLVAEGDDGPFIPAIPAAALIRRARRGSPPPTGARPAAQDLELSDFAPFFSRLAIRVGCHASQAGDPLYRRMLGEAWPLLPEPLRSLHDRSRGSAFAGRAQVERGRGLPARAVAALVGFPARAQDVPVAVRFEERQGVETWRRTFAGRSFSSTQEEGRGRWQGLIVERFGPVAVGIALLWDGERLQLVLRRWSVFGLPLPAALVPGGEIYEEARDGRFRFHVEIRHRFVGLIVRYKGWLKPEG